MSFLPELTIAAALDGLAAKDFSAVELTQAHIGAIESLNPALNAFITQTPELALQMAQAADAARRAGAAGALAGIPLAIKDLFCTEGVRTTAASKILGHFVPPYESTVTAQLKAAGAVFLGKANLDEFAMGSSNTTSGFGAVTNPWQRHGSDAKLVPGGSSGGSAAAVAAGWRWGPPAPIPAARSGSQRRLPVSPASSRPMGGARVMVLSRLLRRWIRPGRWRAASRIARSCWRRCRVSMRATAPVPSVRCRISAPLPGAASKGLRIGIPAEYRMDGMSA